MERITGTSAYDIPLCKQDREGVASALSQLESDLLIIQSVFQLSHFTLEHKSLK